jgi:hypothetical protein
MNVELNPMTPASITMTSYGQRDMNLYLIILCEQKYLYCLRTKTRNHMKKGWIEPTLPINDVAIGG